MSNRKIEVENITKRLAEEEWKVEMESHGLDSALKDYSEHSSLSIKILSIVGGILATLALILFLQVTGMIDSMFAKFLAGCGFIFLSFLIKNIFKQLFLDTTSVCLYLAGFILLIVSFDKYEYELNQIIGIIAMIGLFTLIFMQTYLFTFLSSLILFVCVLTWIIMNEYYLLFHVYILALITLLRIFYFNEAIYIRRNSLCIRIYNPLRISVLFAFALGLIMLCKRNLFDNNIPYVWISSLVIIGFIVEAFWFLLKRNQVKLNEETRWGIQLGALALLSLFFAPAVLGALYVILISFYVQHKASLVIGVLGFIYFLGQYYYDLEYTLLVKSLFLLISGISLLIMYWFLYKKNERYEKV